MNKLNIILVMSIILIVDSSSNMFSSALPIIAEFFNTSAFTVQSLLGFNIFGLALAGLIYGPISDYYGRKRVILVGLFIFTVATFGASVVSDLKTLVVLKFVQGMGQASAIVLGYAVIRDMHNSDKSCAKVISQVNLAAAFAPAIMPVLGGIIASYYSWRLIFLIPACFGAAAIVLFYFFFNESLQQPRSCNLSSYLTSFVNRNFIIYTLINNLAAFWLWSDIVNWPFIFRSLGVPSSRYGFYITAAVGWYMTGKLLNQALIKKITVKKALVLGISMVFANLFGIAYSSIREISPLLVILFASIPYLGLAIIMSNSTSLALESSSETVGYRCAILIFMQRLFAALGIFISSKWCAGSLVKLWSLGIICSSLSLFIYNFSSSSAVNK